MHAGANRCRSTRAFACTHRSVPRALEAALSQHNTANSRKVSRYRTSGGGRMDESAVRWPLASHLRRCSDDSFVAVAALRACVVACCGDDITMATYASTCACGQVGDWACVGCERVIVSVCWCSRASARCARMQVSECMGKAVCLRACVMCWRG